MKLFKFFLKARKNNKGETLVEVVVAMLILAIIAIPLLNSFGTVSKVNLNTRKGQYANAVASNLMEGIKRFGIASSTLQLNGVDTFKLYTESGTTVYGESLKDFETRLLWDTAEASTNLKSSVKQVGSTQFKFAPRTEKRDDDDAFNTDYVRKYYFYINGIKEGTLEFDAHITFDAAAADALPTIGTTVNTYQMADLTTLNSVRTALVAPSGVWYTLDAETGEYDPSKSFETEALRVFTERYNDYANTRLTLQRVHAEKQNELINRAIGAYIPKSSSSLGNNFNRYYANYRLTSADLGKNLDLSLNGTNRVVTQEVLDESIRLRKAAYDYYTSDPAYTNEYASYTLSGVTLEGYPDYTEIDSIQKQDKLGILGGTLTSEEIKRIIASKLERTTYISISPEPSGIGVKISSKTVFFFNQGGDELLCAADASDEDKEDALYFTCEGYFTDMHFDSLDYIYLFQDANRYALKSDKVILDTFDMGETAVSNNKDGVVNVYLVWQYLTADFNNDSVEFVFAGKKKLADNFRLFLSEENHPKFLLKLQEQQNGAVAGYTGTENQSLISNSSVKDRAYVVTVDIYEHDTDNLVYTLKTTIKE